MTSVWVWAGFLVNVAVIGFAGYRLSVFGSQIAEHLGWSRAWAGLILLATVTSLPELVTGISAVTLADAPNVALGDVLGSCVFNLMILAVVDLLYPGNSVYSVASQGHILSAALGVVLISVAGINILLAHAHIGYQFNHIGAYSILIVVMYLVAARMIFQYERAQMSAFLAAYSEAAPVTISLRRACVGYAVAASFVVAASVTLPFIGKSIALIMGWHTTFAGSLFVAFATSVPELAVTISALRIGALDMAISNVLGSNLFDILIIAVDDVLYLDGPLLARVSMLHVITAMVAVLMSGMVIVGLIYRAKTKVFKAIGWISMALMVLYLLNGFVVYLQGE